MPVAKPVSSNSKPRVIAHVDMDCFYVQVEQRNRPELRGLPTAVVQYNEWKGGGLIAVGYEARKHGVKRSMRGDEAKAICPEIHLVQVPVARGKADLTIYRNAGSEVVSILARKGRCERASIDEVYLDLTDAAEMMLAESPPESLGDIDEEALKSHVLGVSEEGNEAKDCVRTWLLRSDADHDDKLLCCGALLVAELRRQVLIETEFTCSAGVAHNKMLAKLASGLNKPAQQTIVPSSAVKDFLGPLPVKKMKQLGGKLGDTLQSDLGINTVGDLLQFSEQKLQELYGFNTGTWLWNTARGISGEEVEGRVLPKSHGSGKTFPGPRALKSIDKVTHWLKQLCEELSERLAADFEQNKRMAQTLTLHVRAYKSSDRDSSRKFPSKSCPLRYGTLKIQEDALRLFNVGLREFMGVYGVKGDKNNKNGWGVTGLSVSAGKIVATPQGTGTIMNFFQSQCVTPCDSSLDSNEKQTHEEVQYPDSDRNLWSNPFGQEEKTFTHHHMSSSCQNNEKGILLNNQEQPCLSDQEISEATACVFGEEGGCPLDVGEASGQEPTLLPVSAVAKLHDQELKKAKGTSILRFLKRSPQSCSSLKLEQNQNLLGASVPSSSGNVLDDNGLGGQTVDGRERWSYNAHEIDPNILKELPLDIQEEFRGMIRPLKQPLAKRNCITSYFSPTNGTS